MNIFIFQYYNCWFILLQKLINLRLFQLVYLNDEIKYDLLSIKAEKKNIYCSYLTARIYIVANGTLTTASSKWISHFATLDSLSATSRCIVLNQHLTCCSTIGHRWIIAWTKFARWYSPWMKWNIKSIRNGLATTSIYRKYFYYIEFYFTKLCLLSTDKISINCNQSSK